MRATASKCVEPMQAGMGRAQRCKGVGTWRRWRGRRYERDMVHMYHLFAMHGVMCYMVPADGRRMGPRCANLKAHIWDPLCSEILAVLKQPLARHAEAASA